MIIETAVENTIRAADVQPGQVVCWDDEYWIRGDASDEYHDPMYVRLSDGNVDYPDENRLVVPVLNAKVVL